MKKFVLVFVVCLILFVFGALYFCGSFGQSNQYNVTSQIEYNFFNLTAKRYFAECYFGERESVFEYDGNSTPKVEYGIFRVILNFSSDYAQSINAYIKINGKEKIYILEKNPFDNSFMCDICKVYYDDADIQILIENIDDDYQQFSSVSSNWNIDFQKAMNLSFKYLKNFAIKNTNNFEGYLTIVYNRNLVDTQYFWCYRLVTKDNQVKLVLFDTNLGDVILMSWNYQINLIYLTQAW